LKPSRGLPLDTPARRQIVAGCNFTSPPEAIPMLGPRYGTLFLTLGVLLAAPATVNAIWPAAALPQAAGGDSAKVRGLLKDRLAVLRQAAAIAAEAHRRGEPYSQLARANRAVRRAELELCTTDAERAAVLEKALAGAREAEDQAQAMHKAGLVDGRAPLQAKADRLKAEIALERVRGR
jgi:hypothetical protein